MSVVNLWLLKDGVNFRFRLSIGKFLYLLNSYSRTFRKGCPVQLVLRASEDGNALIVKKFFEDHNHILSKVCTLLAGYILANFLDSTFTIIWEIFVLKIMHLCVNSLW